MEFFFFFSFQELFICNLLYIILKKGILKKGFMNTQERISSKPSCKSVKVSMCKLHGA